MRLDLIEAAGPQMVLGAVLAVGQSDTPAELVEEIRGVESTTVEAPWPASSRPR